MPNDPNEQTEQGPQQPAATDADQEGAAAREAPQAGSEDLDAVEVDVDVEVEVAPRAESRGPATSALSKAIAALQQARVADRDRLLRLAAEHDNFKKRSKRETRDSIRRAEERVVLEFLPVVDNLERALAHTESEDVGAEAAALMDGVRMVHKQFLSTLEKYEIKPFESLGQPFAPERHEAVQQMPSAEPPSTVCRELQRGYLRGDHLVRPAMVVVSTGPDEAAAQGAGDASRQAGDTPVSPPGEEES